jgi:hypothetical protein
MTEHQHPGPNDHAWETLRVASVRSSNEGIDEALLTVLGLR